MLTPYQFASNTPIAAIDLDGLEAKLIIDKALDAGKKIYTTYQTAKLVYNSARQVFGKVKSFEDNLNNTIDNSDDVKEISFALATEFLTGLGPEERHFEESHPFTQSLMHSRTARIALEKWTEGHIDYLQGNRETRPEYYAVSWPDIDGSFPFLHGNETGPIREGIEDGGFTAAQFTGSAIFYFSYDSKTSTLNVDVYDDKNLRSLSLHLINDTHSREDMKVLGKTVQTYNYDLKWEEILEMVPQESKPSESPTGMGPHAGRSPKYPKSNTTDENK